jgi:hypothetical protein
MLSDAMTNSGSYRVPSRNRAFDAYLDPGIRSARLTQRLIDSLRSEISDAEGPVRLRRVIESPREIYRLEIDSPALGYQRTTLLDRDALEELLEAEEVRARVNISPG